MSRVVREFVVKKGKIENKDRPFDFHFWQSQSSTARFAAAWDLVVQYHITVKGEDEAKLRLQRTVAVLKQQ